MRYEHTNIPNAILGLKKAGKISFSFNYVNEQSDLFYLMIKEYKSMRNDEIKVQVSTN